MRDEGDEPAFVTASAKTMDLKIPANVDVTAHVMRHIVSFREVDWLGIAVHWVNKTESHIGWVSMPLSERKKIERAIEYMVLRNRLGLDYETDIDEGNYNDCVCNKRA